MSNLNITSATCLNAGTNKLTYTFEVVEDGCGAFDVTNLVISTGLDDDTGTVTNQTGTGTSGDPYVFTVAHDISGPGDDNDGDYDITIDATDDAGNNAIQLDPAGDEFTVDKL